MQPPTYPPAYDEPLSPPPWWQDRLKVGLVAVVGILGIVAITLLLIVMNASGREGASASPTATPSTSSLEPTPSPSGSVPSPSESPAASSSASASASASASPSGEPQAELALGWNRIDTALNLRGSPGEESPVVRRLQPGELVWLDSEGFRDGEHTWYYAVTLTEDSGYIAGGPADEPFASLVSNRFVFSSCGSVATNGNHGFVNGLRTARLTDFELAAFALANTMDTRACVRYSMEDYDPTSKLTMEVHACGSPFQDPSGFGLSPAAGDVDPAWLVDEALFLPDVLLTSGQRTDDVGLTNHKKALILGSRLTTPFACVTAEVIKRESNDQGNSALLIDVTGCLVMTQNGREFVTFAPADSGEGVRFLKEGRGNVADVTLSDPNILNVHTGDRTLGSQLIGDC